MLKRLCAAALCLVVALPLTASADDASDQAAINAIWDSYQTARVAGDAEAWLALWDDDGIQMPPGIPARGKDVLMQGVPKAFAARPATAMEISPEEIVIMGDWAFSRGNYTATVMAGEIASETDGKFMTIFRRQDDGSWRIYRDIFNSNK
ncbi:nuclear transport factor 2 family protein [Aestuariicoccus sp. MJ-SS9]|uniref:YybH family protein n=1 Tax=Aestuariicoccus sp. MJ-SS9 TaxID=3079855 RepID=UPI0029119AA5|nr:nuclear transport factor 2 family protein [Aestuariicoccus sp. MJ-SS9]MDU8912943.1 nuclear transport factor 2 family protein [Aestuariicoccus sp. MJ-SS9]